MPVAVGVVQTQGFPTVLAVADAGVKAGRVTVAIQETAESGQQFVVFRGSISEVKAAMAAGVAAGQETPGEYSEVVTHYIVPNPPENLIDVLPLNYVAASEPFRENPGK
ncbi:microcompartments protein [Thalassoporum mexicanum PCC 7367]|uniref:BMC domain-containing protein n=1 Tax=Thalassoporum mexicanum TaxID=3457544 RepID=UPI00029FBF6A|nr:BMC domain-containing protein [Pseudanabaena sp. PCC 7367]AFY68718.1 microcompartments protein [Pseudanabaena sp. PCC 7367]